MPEVRHNKVDMLLITTKKQKTEAMYNVCKTINYMPILKYLRLTVLHTNNNFFLWNFYFV